MLSKTEGTPQKSSHALITLPKADNMKRRDFGIKMKILFIGMNQS